MSGPKQGRVTDGLKGHPWRWGRISNREAIKMKAQVRNHCREQFFDNTKRLRLSRFLPLPLMLPLPDVRPDFFGANQKEFFPDRFRAPRAGIVPDINTAMSREKLQQYLCEAFIPVGKN